MPTWRTSLTFPIVIALSCLGASAAIFFRSSSTTGYYAAGSGVATWFRPFSGSSVWWSERHVGVLDVHFAQQGT